MKNFKKITSFILALVMIVGILPLNAFAISGNEDNKDITTKEYLFDKYEIKKVFEWDKHLMKEQYEMYEYETDDSYTSVNGGFRYLGFDKDTGEFNLSYWESNEDSSGGKFYTYIGSSKNSVNVRDGYHVTHSLGSRLKESIKGDFDGVVTSEKEDAYPEDGIKDNSWYIFKKFSNQKGSFIETLEAKDGFYPDNDIKEGYWYVKKTLVPIVIPLEDEGNKETPIPLPDVENVPEDATLTWVTEPVLKYEEYTAETKQLNVKVGETVNLLEGITNLPADATTEVTVPVDTSTPGDKTGEVAISLIKVLTGEGVLNISYSDGTNKEVTVPISRTYRVNTVASILVSVSENEVPEEPETPGEPEEPTKTDADKYTPVVKPIIVNEKESISEETISSSIEGVPEGTEIVIKIVPDTTTLGEKEVVVDINYPDNSIDSDVKIPVIVNAVEVPEEPETPDEPEIPEEPGETNCSDLKDIILELENKIKELEEERESADNSDEIKALNDKIDELAKELKKLKEEKAKLENELDVLLNDAIAKVKKAENDKTQKSVDDAQDAVNKLPSGEKKNELQDRIDAIQKEVAKGDLEKAEREKLEKALRELIKMIEEGKKALEGNNTKDSEDALLEAINKGIEIGNKENPTLSEIEKAIQDIKYYINHLVPLNEDLEKAKKEAIDEIKKMDKISNDRAIRYIELIKEAKTVKEVKYILDLARKDNGEDPYKEEDEKTKLTHVQTSLKYGDLVITGRTNPLADVIIDGSKNLFEVIKADKEGFFTFVEKNPKVEEEYTLRAKIEGKRWSDSVTVKGIDKDGNLIKTSIGSKNNKFFGKLDNNLEDFILKVRKKIEKDLVISEATSKDKEFTSLKYVFMIDSYRYAEATNKDECIYKMDVKPIIQNDRTMMPLRYVGYVLGAEVNWNEKTRTASFTKDGLTASIQIDGNKIQMSDGRTFEMDSKPTMVNGRTMVSLTNVSKVYGITNGDMNDGVDHDIEWNGTDRTVTIFIQR